MTNEYIELPKTQGLLSSVIPTNIFFLNRDFSSIGIRKTLNKYLRQRAKERNRSAALVENQVAMSAENGEKRFYELTINASLRVNPRFNDMPRVVDPDDRTLFATFSRGRSPFIRKQNPLLFEFHLWGLYSINSNGRG